MHSLYRAIILISIWGASAAINAEPLIKVTLNNTTLCYPSKYSPNTSFTDSLLAPVENKLDVSQGEKLVYIPASEMAQLVKGYVKSHANKYNPAVPHDIRGIIYPKSSFSTPNGMAEKAWNIHQEKEIPIIEKDEKVGLYRVYLYGKSFGPWFLVKSEPVKEGKNKPPEDWYVGYCSELVGSVSCSVRTEYKSVFYEYKISEHNLHLRDAIKSTIYKQIKDWESNCERS